MKRYLSEQLNRPGLLSLFLLWVAAGLLFVSGCENDHTAAATNDAATAVSFALLHNNNIQNNLPNFPPFAEAGQDGVKRRNALIDAVRAEVGTDQVLLVDLTATYRITTNNFMAGGGDFYQSLGDACRRSDGYCVDSGLLMLNTLVEELTLNSPKTKAIEGHLPPQ